MTSRKLHSIHNKQLRIEKRKEEKDKPATSKAYMEDLSRRTKIQKIKVETDAYSIASDSNHLPLSPHHLLSQESTTSSVRRKSPRKIVQKSSVRDKYRPFVNLDHPTISMSDKKKYRVIKLDNGLTCCLISDEAKIDEEWEDLSDSDFSSEEEEMEGYTSDDKAGTDYEPDVKMEFEKKETKMAAVALCVGVGSFHDPHDVPGMAHFLEHMVFMGSQKYPKENDFDSFIKKSGGSDNASTDCELTTFHFEVFEKYLPKAIDKFSQFFISPLCKKDSMLKEREAIDSEFAQAKPKDSYRSEQLMFNMFNDKTKINKFQWGNLQTLLYTDISDETLYEKLHAFRKKYYVARRMTLAIQARLPIEILVQYATEYFGKIPMGREIAPPSYQKFGDEIFDHDEFNKIYYVKPIKNIYEVILSWKMPSQMKNYLQKPHHYIASLLGEESKGSLLSFLKNKVWALGIEAGCDDGSSEHNSLYCLFQIKIVLTEDGLDNVFEVINSVYSYINMLKSNGPSQRYYEELQQLSQISFQYQQEITSEDNVIQIAENLHYYPSKDLLTGPLLFFKYCEDNISFIMGKLVPENMNIMIFSSYLPTSITFDQSETWFHTKYATRPIPKKLYGAWDNEPIKVEFCMPKINSFITRDFGLVDPSVNTVQSIFPKKIVLKENFCELWYMLDTKFKLPFAYYNFHLVNVKFMETCENACMSDMLVRILNLMMSEETYPALVAQLSYLFTTSELGFIIKVGGFNEKLQELLLIIVHYLKNLQRNVTEKLFNVVKHKQMISYYNQFIKAGHIAKDLRLKVLLGKHYTSVHKHEVTNLLTYNKFMEYISNIFDHVFVQILVEGNVSENDAFDIAYNFHKRLQYENLIRAPYLILKDNLSEKGLKEICESCEKRQKEDKFEYKVLESETNEAMQAAKTRPPLNMQVLQLPLGEHCVRTHGLNPDDSNSVVTNYYQIGPYNASISVTLELLMMIIDEPLFDTLRTKNGLGYEVYSTFRDTFNILGYTITVVSQENKHTTAKVEDCIEDFRGQIGVLLRKMSQKKFKSYVSDLLKVKKVADTDLKQQVDRHWQEIMSQNLMFKRNQVEIKALEELTLKQLRQFWDIHNTVRNHGNFRKLTVQVIGNIKLSDSFDLPYVQSQCTRRTRRPSLGLPSETNLNFSRSAKEHIYKIDLIGSKEETWAENKFEGYFIRNIEIFVSVLTYFVTNVQVASQR